MDSRPIQTLQTLTSAKIAVLMWNENYIRFLLKRHSSRLFIPSNVRNVERKAIENVVMGRLQKVNLEESLKEQLKKNIKFVGEEIQAWMEYHVENQYLGIELPNQFYWISQRIIDNKKTAEAVIRDENLDVIKRYKIACLYCFENDADMLWSKIPDYRRQYICRERHPTVREQHELVTIWTSLLSGDLQKFKNIKKNLRRGGTLRQYAFECAALAPNTAAIEYFLARLKPEEKLESLQKSAKDIKYRLRSRNNGDMPAKYYSDNLCFIILQMDKRERKAFLMDDWCGVLKSFLVLPRQHHFLEILNSVWNCLPVEVYWFLWIFLLYKIHVEQRDYDYWALFEEFWQRSPPGYKQCVIKECAENKTVLLNLLKLRQTKIIQLILRSASYYQKQQIIFHRKDVCEELVCSDKLDKLELLIQECLSSKITMVTFKNEFKVYLLRRRPREIIESVIWKRTFQLLERYC